MNTNLFKSTEFYHRRYHNFATLFIIPLTLLLGFFVIFSLFATKEITVNSQGEITPIKVIASIQSTSNNSIIKNNLVNNKLIKKNEPLIQYSKTMEESQKKALESQLSTLERQKSGLETLKSSLAQGTNLFSDNDEFGYLNTFNNFMTQSKDIELSINKANTEVSNQENLAGNTVNAIDNQIQNLQQEITDYQELENAITNNTTKLSSNNPYQSTLDSYMTQLQQQPLNELYNQYIAQINQSISSLRSSIANLNIQKAGTGSTAAYDNSLSTKIEALRSQFQQSASQQLSTTENQITDLKSQLEQASVRLNNDTITAQKAGIVHLNNEFEGKTLIPNGSEIAQIYPNITKTKKVLITYYVPSEYVSLLKIKQKTRLILNKIGNHSLTINGNIESIDKTATKTKNGNFFKITAHANLSNTESKVISYRLQGRVVNIIAKKTYFDYYKDKILSNLD